MDQNQKIRNLELKLHALVFLLIIAIVGSAFVFFPNLKNAAQALTGNYNRNAAVPAENELGLAAWNLLDEDFLNKSGDAMEGVLDMDSNSITNLSTAAVGVDTDAANRGYVLSQIGSAVSMVDESGNNLRMICGRTTPGLTNWQVHNSETIFVEITLPASAGFTMTPYYLTSLAGDGWLQRVQGSSSIFFPSNTGFTSYIRYTTGSWAPTDANTWNWHLNWCAVGL